MREVVHDGDFPAVNVPHRVDLFLRHAGPRAQADCALGTHRQVAEADRVARDDAVAGIEFENLALRRRQFAGFDHLPDQAP